MAGDLIPNIKKENIDNLDKESDFSSGSALKENTLNSQKNIPSAETSSNSDLESKKPPESNIEQKNNGKFCINCGTEMSIGYDTKIFCPKCGFKPNNNSSENKENNTDSKKKLYFFILKVVLWIGLGLLVIYITTLFLDIIQDTLSMFL